MHGVYACARPLRKLNANERKRKSLLFDTCHPVWPIRPGLPLTHKRASLTHLKKEEKKKKKDALNLFLEVPMGRIKKMPVYYYYFKVQTSCWQKWVMWTVRTTSSVSKPTATLHCLFYWQERNHYPKLLEVLVHMTTQIISTSVLRHKSAHT